MVRYKVTLSKKEREYLLSVIKKGSHKSRKYQNVLILLNCDEGEFSKKTTNQEICKILKIGMRTIDRLKKCFVEEGFDIALNGKKSDRVYKKKVDGNVEAHLIALSCSTPPRRFFSLVITFISR